MCVQGTGWPYDGSCYHTEEGYLTCSTGGSPSAGGTCAGSEDACSCDDKFACDGCHSEYPHDMGFVMEKVGSGFACVPECVFAGKYGTHAASMLPLCVKRETMLG